jgi:hypothetical protein
MRYPILCLILLSAFFAPANSQPVDTWRSYVSHIAVQDVLSEPDGDLWVISTGGLYHRSTEGTITQYSKLDGLYGTNPTTLLLDAPRNRVWLGYDDGTYSYLDVETSVIRTFTDIQRNTRFPTRRINQMVLSGDDILVGTDFGIVIVRAETGIVADSYTNLGSFGSGIRVRSLVRNDGVFILGTDSGIAVGDPSTGDLLVSTSWDTYPTPNPVVSMGYQNDILYLTHGTENARFMNDAIEPVGIWPFAVARYVPISDGGLAGVQLAGIAVLKSDQTVETITLPNSGARHSSITRVGTNWVIGTFNQGLFIRSNMTDERITLNTPYLNLFSQLHYSDGVLAVASSSTPGQVNFIFQTTGYSLLNEENWENVNLDTSPFFTERGLNSVYRVTSNADHYFFGTFGSGIIRRSKTADEHEVYNGTNSNLPGFTPTFIVNTGLSAARNGNIWATMLTNTNEPLAEYDRTTEEWTRYSVSSKAPNLSIYRDVFVDSYDQKWIILATPTLQGRGLLVTTFDADGEEASFRLTTNDTEGALPNETVRAVVQDQRGEIWVGTDRGVVRFLFPDRIINGSTQERRSTPLINEDPTVSDRILLRDIQVTAMAVDPSNQKWVGTLNDGIWLISESGGAVLKHFTTENSPLVSNRIQSIAIDSQTGEVYIATDLGMVGYVAESTVGVSDMKELVVYPNPFQYSSYSGSLIYIEGLKDDATVHVLSVDGTLVKRMDTRGGRVSWDGLDERGNRLPTGIYSIVGTHASGAKGSAKILMMP